jgi:hypothetical protein
MSRTVHLRIQRFIVNVDGYKSRKTCFCAVSHPPKMGGGLGCDIDRSSMSAVGLMNCLQHHLPYILHNFRVLHNGLKTDYSSTT